MNRNDDHLDSLDRQLDRAIDDIRDESVDSSAVNEAASRVWDRLSDELDLSAGEPETIRSCSDYQALIPTYLEGELGDARKLLLEDHSRECIPCRRALNSARSARVAGPTLAEPARTSPSASLVWKMAVAAAVVLAVVFAGYQWWYIEKGSPIVVAGMSGSLFEVTGDGPVPVSTGAAFEGGERIRTAKDSGAVVELADGSRIEMNERSQIRVTERRDDATIHLTRGSIIVEASEQGSGHLFVRTDDCLVSVTGTVFSVVHGSRGSRVSVIEGEVHVDSPEGVEVLHRGQQVSTSPLLLPIPIAQEIAWSGNLDEHLAMLKEISEIQRELDAISIPGRRSSTALLDQAPEGTIIYIGLPNLGETLAEAHTIVREKVETSPTLKKWWDENMVATGAEPQLDEAIEKMRQLGEQFGDEIVVTLQEGGPGEDPQGPVLLAHLTDVQQFREFVAAEIESHQAEFDGATPVRIVENPFAQVGLDGDAELLLYIQDNLLVGAPKIDQLQHMASLVGTPGSGRFVGSPFHHALSETYRDGVSIVFGADMQSILKNHAEEIEEDEVLETLGLMDVQHIIVERHDAGDRTVTSANLTFGEARKGLASWLAEPAPMGALEFVSADATAVAAFVVKRPASLLEELFNAVGEVDDEFKSELDRVQSEAGVDLIKDVAGPLGGEIVLALDGPVLPKPAWKLVAEVYDQGAMQFAFEIMVGEVNEFAAREGKPVSLSILNEDIGGRTYYTLHLAEIDMSIHYLYDDGYLVMAPERGLLDRAVQYRRSGYTLTSSPEFIAQLPEDGRAHFSAIYYQNIGPVLNPLLQSSIAKSAPLTDEQRELMDDLAKESRPSLFYAYAETDRIVMGGIDHAGLLGTNLGAGFQLGSILGLQDTLRHAAESHGSE